MAQYTNYGYLNSQNKKQKQKHNNNFKTLLLFYILPFIVVNVFIFFLVTAQPNYELTIADTNDYKTVDISIKLGSLYPKKSFTIMLDSTPIEMTKEKNHTYTATLTANGTLEVSVTNINGMNKTAYEHIAAIDDAPPIVSTDDISDGHISLSLEDTQSGIDFNKIYGIDDSGKKIEPSMIDEGNSSVKFTYGGGSLEVHASDMVGNESVSTLNDSLEDSTNLDSSTNQSDFNETDLDSTN